MWIQTPLKFFRAIKFSVSPLPAGDLNVFKLVLFESSSTIDAPPPPVELLRLLYIFCCASSGVGDDISDTEVEISRDSLRFGGGGFGFLSLSSPDELVDWSELVDGEGEIERELRV